MKFTKEQIEFIKMHRSTLEGIIKNRTEDYFNQVVDEPEPARKEVLSLLVKEFRMALVAIENITNTEELDKTGDEFTGV